MRRPENTRELRDDGLTVMLELKASCICSSISAPKQPCVMCAGAEMIQRLLNALYVQRDEEVEA